MQADNIKGFFVLLGQQIDRDTKALKGAISRLFNKNNESADTVEKQSEVHRVESRATSMDDKSIGDIDVSDLSYDKLQNLTPEELYVLLHNIRNIFASGDPENYLVPDEALQAFMEHCSNRIGSAYFQTPRTSIKAFVDLLSILEQHPDKQ